MKPAADYSLQTAEPPQQPQCRTFLRVRRGILKCAKRTTKLSNNGVLNCVLPKKIKPISSDGNNSGFDGSHGSTWIRGHLLGKGGYGSVYLATLSAPIYPNSHLPIAVKSSFMENSSSLQFEKKVLHDLHHCFNVVQCYGAEITKTSSGEEVYNLLLEYCSGGSLFDHIFKIRRKSLPEVVVRRYTRDILQGMTHIHSHNYVHGDIKLENILLTPDTKDKSLLVAKIADLGLAKKMSDVVVIDEDNLRGTHSYMSPEMVRDNYSDWHADIWAVGCVVVEMLSGARVWTPKISDRLSRLSSNGELGEAWSRISPAAEDFLRRCLARNPFHRTSARLLLDHPFVYV